MANDGVADYTGSGFSIYRSLFVGNSATLDGEAVGASFSSIRIYGSTIIQQIVQDGDIISGDIWLNSSIVAAPNSDSSSLCSEGSLQDYGDNLFTDASCASEFENDFPSTIVTLEELALNAINPDEPAFVYPKAESPAINGVAGDCIEQADDQFGNVRADTGADGCDVGAIDRPDGALSADDQEAPVVTWDDFAGIDTVLDVHIDTERARVFSTTTEDVCSIDASTGALTPLDGGACHVVVLFYHTAEGDDEISITSNFDFPNVPDNDDDGGSADIESEAVGSGGSQSNHSSGSGCSNLDIVTSGIWGVLIVLGWARKRRTI